MENEPATPGTQAVANLVGALMAGLMANGMSPAGLKPILDIFDSLNDGSIPPGPDLATLQQATAMQRAILERLG